MKTSPVNMALGQLITNEILDQRLLDAMTGTPREHFVPEHLRGCAYVDDAIAISDTRAMLDPLTFARMLALADIGWGEKVLDIGVGLGYSSAVIASLGAEVVAVESDMQLASAAIQKISSEGTPNIKIIHVNNLADGCITHSPYDVVIIHGAVAAVPDAIVKQMKEGARLVAIKPVLKMPIGGNVVQGRLFFARKENGVLQTNTTVEASAPLLNEFNPREEFSF